MLTQADRILASVRVWKAVAVSGSDVFSAIPRDRAPLVQHVWDPVTDSEDKRVFKTLTLSGGCTVYLETVKIGATWRVSRVWAE